MQLAEVPRAGDRAGGAAGGAAHLALGRAARPARALGTLRELAGDGVAAGVGLALVHSAAVALLARLHHLVAAGGARRWDLGQEPNPFQTRALTSERE